MTNNVYGIPVTRIDGRPATLSEYRGKVLLVVNVASQCGLTPQYEGLQRLYANKHDLGLEVLGFPCNDFGGQEPGTSEEIATFCSTNYAVEFPLFQRITVLGPDKHPLYRTLIAAQPDAEGGARLREGLSKHGKAPAAAADVVWNFEKFVIDRTGAVAARFAPDVKPDDPRLLAALDTALAQRATR